MCDDNLCTETFEDFILAGSKEWMSHQERYQFIKNRIYKSSSSANIASVPALPNPIIPGRNLESL